MADTCFSGSALTLLGIIGGAITSGFGILFWGWIKSLERRVEDARETADQRVQDAQEERNRAATNLEKALNIGETTAGLRAPRRRT